VEQVNPDLVDRNNKSEVESVRYDMVNAMLLNEFLKEHRKVEEQQATIGRLETTAAKQVATITELKSTVAQQQKDYRLLRRVSTNRQPKSKGERPARRSESLRWRT